MARPTALVTGSASGMGLATALELARAGYQVAAAVRTLGRADSLLKMADAAGVADRVEPVAMDLLEGSEALKEAAEAVIQGLGHLDVLVNNAGTAELGAVEEVPPRLWRRVMATNFFAPLALIQAALPGMRERQQGVIINVTSFRQRAAERRRLCAVLRVPVRAGGDVGSPPLGGAAVWHHGGCD